MDKALLWKSYPTVVYAQDELPKTVVKSIFLAGPTSRGSNRNALTPWRVDALKIQRG